LILQRKSFKRRLHWTFICPLRGVLDWSFFSPTKRVLQARSFTGPSVNIVHWFFKEGPALVFPERSFKKSLSLVFQLGFYIGPSSRVLHWSFREGSSQSVGSFKNDALCVLQGGSFISPPCRTNEGRSFIGSTRWVLKYFL